MPLQPFTAGSTEAAGSIAKVPQSGFRRMPELLAPAFPFRDSKLSGVDLASAQHHRFPKGVVVTARVRLR